jgi:RNA polymerase sigma-70 factor (ECF subfamily)
LDTVHSTALHLARNPDDAGELTQETFLRAFRAWHQFVPGTNCKAWLLTILTNVFRNRYRAQRQEPPTVELDEAMHQGDPSAAADVHPAPETLVLEQVFDEEVAQALGAMPAEFREAVVLVDLQELTYEEAAAAAGCPIGTIRSRLSRGRLFLHRALLGYAKARGIVR